MDGSSTGAESLGDQRERGEVDSGNSTWMDRGDRGGVADGTKQSEVKGYRSMGTTPNMEIGMETRGGREEGSE